jgi:hypothetical protein
MHQFKLVGSTIVDSRNNVEYKYNDETKEMANSQLSSLYKENNYLWNQNTVEHYEATNTYGDLLRLRNTMKH